MSTKSQKQKQRKKNRERRWPDTNHLVISINKFFSLLFCLYFCWTLNQTWNIAVNAWDIPLWLLQERILCNIYQSCMSLNPDITTHNHFLLHVYQKKNEWVLKKTITVSVYIHCKEFGPQGSLSINLIRQPYFHL